MKLTDVDWRTILNNWTKEDLEYLKGIVEEKIRQSRR